MATVLVTGANRGLGLALCEELHERKDAVIAVCRTSSPALDKLDVRVEAGVEVTSDVSVAELVRRLGDSRIDVLINNAGTLGRDELPHIDFESIRRQMEVNALGPLRVTAALLPLLNQVAPAAGKTEASDEGRPSARVAVVTSQMGSIGDNSSGGHYGYRMSKAAVNMAAVSLARDLRPRKIAVAVIHPGYVKTDMTGGRGTVEPREAARGLLARLDELTLKTSGSFWHARGRELPW